MSEYFDPEVHYLGKACKHKHYHKGTKKSRRYISNQTCCVCHKNNFSKYLAKNSHKKEIPLQEKIRRQKVRGIAALHCKRHYKCLDEISKTFKEEMPCYKCEHIKEVIKNEKGVTMP